MNSGIGGMSSFSIFRLIIFVAIQDMPGIAPSQVGMCMPGLPTVATLILLVALLADRVEAEEGEEEVRLDALHAGAVGHDQAGVDALERALRDR